MLAEGDTERAAATHLKAFLDARSQGVADKVRLKVLRQDGGLLERSVRGLSEAALRDSSTIGVVALTDVYPKFTSAQHARQTIQAWMPADSRCHVHVALHDFEAWLLVGWEALLKQAGVTARKPWSARPESVNGNNPPAHRIGNLFQTGKPPRKYKKPVHGQVLFEKLDLVQVADACPEFKLFLNCVLTLSGYPVLT